MSIKIDPGEVEPVLSDDRRRVVATRYRDCDFPTGFENGGPALGYAVAWDSSDCESRSVILAWLAMELRDRVAAMSAHQRLAFFAETQAGADGD